MPGILARQERFAVVGSTNDVVRQWLADGTPEVCLAVADEQSAGRGRDGRSWTAPPGSSLLLSLGFRPAWLAPEHAWRLGAVVSLAMAEAADDAVGGPSGTIRLKWPNDVVTLRDGAIRKLAGVLGETDGLGSTDPRAVVGIGVNADWAAADFPAALADSMTSLREIAGRAFDRGALLDGFIGRLEPAVEGLRDGRFAARQWIDRQVTTGHDVELVDPDGGRSTVRAVGVDTDTGALLVADPGTAQGTRSVMVGEIRHVRPATRAGAGV